MADNYYSILGISSNATTKQIRERFLQLAREQHPDRILDGDKVQAETEFQKITESYNVLHDPERRRQFDQEQAMKSQLADGVVTGHAARVYLRRGVEAYKKKHFQEAAKNFEQATTEDPRDAQAWHYLGRVIGQRTSLLTKGLAASAKACELDPMNAEYLRLAGDLASQAGMTARAIKYYHDALTFGGEDPELRLAIQQLKKSGG
jgi:curved DNA-binding protein CbpA